MFKVTIHHNQQGQAAIKFDTEDRVVARAAALVGRATGVKVEVVETIEPRPVTFRNL